MTDASAGATTGDDEAAPTRRQRGVEMYRKIYGDDAITMEAGSSDFFDLMMEHLFGEVWSRPALDVPTRRLLVMGVLAAQHRFETLQIQFARAVETGELTPEQVREMVIHLVAYVGYPSSSDLFRVAETAIASAARSAKH